jgi:hypothetical protein
MKYLYFEFLVGHLLSLILYSYRYNLKISYNLLYQSVYFQFKSGNIQHSKGKS